MATLMVRRVPTTGPATDIICGAMWDDGYGTLVCTLDPEHGDAHGWEPDRLRDALQRIVIETEIALLGRQDHETTLQEVQDIARSGLSYKRDCDCIQPPEGERG